MSTADITVKIQGILNKRRPQIRFIEQVQENLSVLGELLAELEKQVNHENEANAISILRSSNIRQEVTTVQKELNQLRARFSRDTLNIGVIGRARQGKSQLLQSLTGLGNAEIPASDGMHCTGVRSAIFHRPGTTTSARVYYYTEEEFLQEVISPYFIALNLGQIPETLEQFSQSDISLIDAGATEGAKWERLKKYQDQLPLYRDLLGRPSEDISREQIPEYVAQYDVKDSSRTFHNYLAIREIQIFCPFPNSNVGQIAVIDMPGLGDTGLGDDTRLIEALGQEIDLILFVRLPRNTGDHWADYDVRLYDTANKALTDIPIKEWSYQILNILEDGSNHKNCDDLIRTMQANHITVVDALKANCKSSEETDKVILQPVLSYMSNEITRIDKQFIQARQKRLDKLREDVLHLSRQVSDSLNIKMQESDHDHDVFRPLFDDFWNKLTSAISDLIDTLNVEAKDFKDKNFVKGLEEAVKNARAYTAIPDQAGIELRKKSDGSYTQAYTNLLDIVRTTLTGHFLQILDIHLAITVEAAKQKVVDSLRESGLAPLSNRTDIGFLHDMVELTSNTDRFKSLNQALSHLASFHLLYRGFIQHRIRKLLDILSADSEYALDYESSAAGIEEKLTLLHRETLQKIEESLSELMWEPSWAIFAAVEEFRDRILRAENVKTRDWEYFMQDHRAEIWASEFRWLALINKVTRACEQNKLTFFK